jgi:tetratricopeptide (TPR) repeat protein
MKKIVVVTWVVLLFLSTVHIAGESSIKILVDESRGDEFEEALKAFYIYFFDFPETTDWRYSFENKEEDWGLYRAAETLRRAGSVNIKTSGRLTYDELKNYDVLVVATFKEEYTTAEQNAIVQFVENGGGLLFLADGDSPNDSVTTPFGVSFFEEDEAIADENAESFRDNIYQFYVTDIADHYITRNIDKIALNYGLPITEYESGEVLARTSADSWIEKEGENGKEEKENGPFDILLVQSVGKGGAVFIGDRASFYNHIVDDEKDNLNLLKDAVKWLGQPGGPYKQYKMLNEKGDTALKDAIELYENHEFLKAKQKFAETIDLYQESYDIYANSYAEEKITEAQSFIPKCETGITADGIFEKAEDSYKNREYEKAITEYEQAVVLYQDIGYTEQVEACNTMVEKSNYWISLREKGESLLQEAESALDSAPSTFDPSGYKQAKSMFEQAKEIWEEYDNPEKVAVCEENINLCNENITKIERTKTMVIVGVIAVIAGIAGIFGFIRIRSARKKE